MVKLDDKLTLRNIHKVENIIYQEKIEDTSQIGEMMTELEKILSKSEPKILLLEGDTNTIVAGALTGIKLARR